jgi:hypothetical protein
MAILMSKNGTQLNFLVVKLCGLTETMGLFVGAKDIPSDVVGK